MPERLGAAIVTTVDVLKDLLCVLLCFGEKSARPKNFPASKARRLGPRGSQTLVSYHRILLITRALLRLARQSTMATRLCRTDGSFGDTDKVPRSTCKILRSEFRSTFATAFGASPRSFPRRVLEIVKQARQLRDAFQRYNVALTFIADHSGLGSSSFPNSALLPPCNMVDSNTEIVCKSTRLLAEF